MHALHQRNTASRQVFCTRPGRRAHTVVAWAKDPDPVSARVTLKLQVPRTTEWGTVLKIVGSGSKLGDWAPRSAPVLHWTAGNVWQCELLLPPQRIEFKIVAWRVDKGEAEWELGPNRVIDVPRFAGTLHARCDWGTPDKMNWWFEELPDSPTAQDDPLEQAVLRALAKRAEEGRPPMLPPPTAGGAVGQAEVQAQGAPWPSDSTGLVQASAAVASVSTVAHELHAQLPVQQAVSQTPVSVAVSSIQPLQAQQLQSTGTPSASPTELLATAQPVVRLVPQQPEQAQSATGTTREPGPAAVATHALPEAPVLPAAASAVLSSSLPAAPAAAQQAAPLQQPGELPVTAPLVAAVVAQQAEAVPVQAAVVGGGNSIVGAPLGTAQHQASGTGMVGNLISNLIRQARQQGSTAASL